MPQDPPQAGVTRVQGVRSRRYKKRLGEQTSSLAAAARESRSLAVPIKRYQVDVALRTRTSPISDMFLIQENEVFTSFNIHQNEQHPIPSAYRLSLSGSREGGVCGTILGGQDSAELQFDNLAFQGLFVSR